MAEKVVNHPDNILIPSGVSFWFREGHSGEIRDIGDVNIDGFTSEPTFWEFKSYHDGVRGTKKRILQERSAKLAMTLNEATIRNLKNAVYGGAVSDFVPSADGPCLLRCLIADVVEGHDSASHLSVNFADLESNMDMTDADDRTSIDVTNVYLTTDVDEEAPLTLVNGGALDSGGYLNFLAGSTGLVAGGEVMVKYKIIPNSGSSFYPVAWRGAEIFGAQDASIEGNAQLQALNPGGGIIQVWELASVTLSPNGDIGYSQENNQTIPLLATLAEYGGTFGTVYTA